jgi:hypothetical protein
VGTQVIELQPDVQLGQFRQGLGRITINPAGLERAERRLAVAQPTLHVGHVRDFLRVKQPLHGAAIDMAANYDVLHFQSAHRIFDRP